LRAVLAIAVTALVMAGCTTRFFYDRIDWLIVWKVGEYVTLTDVQREELQADIQDRLDVLRVGEFPKIAFLLDKTAREIERGPVTPAMIDARYGEMLAVYDQFMLGIVPLSQRFLMGLSQAQVTEFFANLEEINAEMYEEYSGRTAAEREKNRNKSAIDGMQDWTGRLDESQREIIRSGLARMEDASEQWIANQREWQLRFRELIVAAPDAATFKEELTQLLVYPRHFHAPEYRARVDANRQIFNELLADLLNSLDDKQRARAVRKIDGYVAMLNRLSVAD
jgi:hypothetical protein